MKGRDNPLFGNALVVAQVSMSLVLISGAALFARSLWNLRHQNFGMNLNTLRVELPLQVSRAAIAVADTVMYAHIAKPLDGDGKLVVQQYLIREGGSWHAVTGDNATINRFLKNNPSFARRFPIRKPTAYLNQNGKWVAIPLGGRRS